MVRILASIVLLFSILFMPFWVSVILALAGMAYFSFFWEAVLIFLLSDMLYGAPEIKLFHMIYVSFGSALIVLILIELFKQKLR
ncbi:hypothetical protein A3A03_02320 [Candidatus Nomurabacteria bacterium RIFCSPLOWO2_01_FULL_40_18]|uniref:Uncharacterized protein n=1 Tax=Candidatus Nomurabacteria bacterium RIFCSPLOWO2_01_FULL_40_18 TaxID=1801773 RepID=A0A1F6XK32_9BACT|nr:MAG: hypothetical protein A3A03_02320 [Candidatus Nomurabacteria bacterium RIFCSPLOWO2_01_FULL_40_18]